ncbi:DUF2569 domain-containing protein [Candidatus Pacearchaeota archaeon]|nr:DUF2569 domain-containing protein [Candidatus Pacearchaeota archaeon]
MPKKVIKKSSEKKLQGIEGWIIVYLIMIVFWAVGVIYFFIAVPLINDLVASDDYGLAGVLHTGMVAWFFVFLITMYFTFKKRKAAIQWNIGLIVFYAIIVFLMNSVYSSLIQQSGVSNPITAYVLPLAWLWYWNSSIRVKNTFVN